MATYAKSEDREAIVECEDGSLMLVITRTITRTPDKAMVSSSKASVALTPARRVQIAVDGVGVAECVSQCYVKHNNLTPELRELYGTRKLKVTAVQE